MAENRLTSRINRLFAVLEEKEGAGQVPSWALEHARQNIEQSLAWQSSPEGRRL